MIYSFILINNASCAQVCVTKDIKNQFSSATILLFGWFSYICLGLPGSAWPGSTPCSKSLYPGDSTPDPSHDCQTLDHSPEIVITMNMWKRHWNNVLYEQVHKGSIFCCWKITVRKDLSFSLQQKHQQNAFFKQRNVILNHLFYTVYHNLNSCFAHFASNFASSFDSLSNILVYVPWASRKWNWPSYHKKLMYSKAFVPVPVPVPVQ